MVGWNDRGTGVNVGGESVTRFGDYEVVGHSVKGGHVSRQSWTTRRAERVESQKVPECLAALVIVQDEHGAGEVVLKVVHKALNGLGISRWSMYNVKCAAPHFVATETEEICPRLVDILNGERRKGGGYNAGLPWLGIVLDVLHGHFQSIRHNVKTGAEGARQALHEG